MIIIRIDETSHRVVAQGHALFAPKGSDVVCAAVSIVLQSWVVGCRILCKQDVSVVQREGVWEASLADAREEAILLWKNMILTLDILSRQYPENIQLQWEENHGS
jgi:hypothetical protein